MSKLKKMGKQKGFTLLEVLVAIAIMAIAVTLVIQLFSMNARTILASGNLTTAAARGDFRIREIAADPALAETAWSEATNDGLRFDVVVTETMKERTDNLPVKLMEVVLDVRWNEGGKVKSLRLKTMKMVDRMAKPVSVALASG